MAIRTRTETLDTTIARLEREAIRQKSAPRADAGHAATTVRRNLGHLEGWLSPGEVIRVERYFAAVLRRRAARRGAEATFAGRYLLAAVVDDLRAGGKGDYDILLELEEDWARRVPESVMSEYRTLLTPRISA